MSTEVFRALIADTISTMSIEQLRNVILETPDKELGAVGAAVLAEKGKKAVNAEVPPVGMKAVKKKGGTKTVKNTPGKQTPTPVGSSSKRKYDAIDLTLDTPEKKTKANKGNNHVTGRGNGSTANPRTANQGVSDGPMMKRIIEVMDRMDWTKVKCRADMIKLIFEGERTMPGGNRISSIKTIQGMTRLIDQNHAKLQSHPNFAAFYQLAGSTSKSNTPRGPVQHDGPILRYGTATSNCLARLPPFDWAAQMEQLKALGDDPDAIAKSDFYHNINQMVCASYQDIINQCNMGYTGNFEQLVADIHNMARLAINTSNAPTRELQKRLLTGEQLLQLKDCMSAVCKAINRNKLSIASKLDNKERLDIEAHLRAVDRILGSKGLYSGLNTGFQKVAHHFE